MEENRVLRGQLRGKRLRLNDDQRRRLAVKGKTLGRKVLTEVAGIDTPDTILRWYRQLIAKKYDGSNQRSPGRPKTAEPIAVLAVRMATENPGWGYTRLHYHGERHHQGLGGEHHT